MGIELQVQNVSVAAEVPGDEKFQQWVVAALQQRSAGTLAIRIVDEQDGRGFNRDYRQKDYATNVLSFPAELPQGLPGELAENLLGDLLICAPVVISEAHEQGKAAEHHWAHLTVHGVLHLLGYDHEVKADATEMEALEIEILSSLNIPNPY